MFEIYKDKITADFEEYISLIPRRKTEYINAAQSVKGDLSLLFMKAVTQLVITDAVSVPASDLLRHVSAIYKAITTIDYCKNIPHDIFFDFVLPYRVNDEDFAPCADIFYDELYPMVADKSLRVAAKEVNYWCLSRPLIRARTTAQRMPLRLSMWVMDDAARRACCAFLPYALSAFLQDRFTPLTGSIATIITRGSRFSQGIAGSLWALASLKAS